MKASLNTGLCALTHLMCQIGYPFLVKKCKEPNLVTREGTEGILCLRGHKAHSVLQVLTECTLSDTSQQ